MFKKHSPLNNQAVSIVIVIVTLVVVCAIDSVVMVQAFHFLFQQESKKLPQTAIDIQAIQKAVKIVRSND